MHRKQAKHTKQKGTDTKHPGIKYRHQSRFKWFGLSFQSGSLSLSDLFSVLSTAVQVLMCAAPNNSQDIHNSASQVTVKHHITSCLNQDFAGIFMQSKVLRMNISGCPNSPSVRDYLWTTIKINTMKIKCSAGNQNKPPVLDRQHLTHSIWCYHSQSAESCTEWKLEWQLPG